MPGFVRERWRLAAMAGLAIGLFGAGCGVENEQLLKRVRLQDGQLEVRSVSPGSAFGAHKIRFYFVKDGAERFLDSTDLHNDGAVLGEGNLKVSEERDRVWVITLRGQEQQDETWRIDFGGSEIKLGRLDA